MFTEFNLFINHRHIDGLVYPFIRLSDHNRKGRCSLTNRTRLHREGLTRRRLLIIRLQMGAPIMVTIIMLLLRLTRRLTVITRPDRRQVTRPMDKVIHLHTAAEENNPSTEITITNTGEGGIAMDEIVVMYEMAAIYGITVT